VFKETENALLKAIEDLRALDNTSGKSSFQTFYVPVDFALALDSTSG